ncbi:type II toxin-antitoxin system prevent-host-death family antitoxin [Cryobacterium sp. PH31-AA6]|uniref:type II toxin-antitoxin system Phd/YefM family antitoxin n=1 Tax=Cryobacterium sp. PH31-AA6 TaxID=3046205 RepID=UPI0024B959B4|nr:type II toxin-antitoxin system prevent-host-death family antitoxin [Cryobacterium sp. PH31-AA6]MDJ0324882.1 type II toxin-antitoxin system prevent-host-death family antitoxin [Cryobacterium sp. PH31-AA6]
MSLVPVRDLRNHTAEIIERARNGEEVTITVNGVPAATLVPVRPPTRLFLTKQEFLALRPGKPVAEAHPHDLWDDTTDDLGPIQ